MVFLSMPWGHLLGLWKLCWRVLGCHPPLPHPSAEDPWGTFGNHSSPSQAQCFRKSQLLPLGHQVPGKASNGLTVVQRLTVLPTLVSTRMATETGKAESLSKLFHNFFGPELVARRCLSSSMTWSTDPAAMAPGWAGLSARQVYCSGDNWACGLGALGNPTSGPRSVE